MSLTEYICTFKITHRADVQEWEELGCYTTPRGHIRCTCATDFCNAPFSGEGKRVHDLGTGTSSAMTSSIALSIFGVAAFVVMFRNKVMMVQ